MSGYSKIVTDDKLEELREWTRELINDLRAQVTALKDRVLELESTIEDMKEEV